MGKLTMKIACFSVHRFERPYIKKWADKVNDEVTLYKTSLNKETVSLAKGFDAITCWPSDILDKEVLEELHKAGVRFVSLRSAGYSHLDINTARDLCFRVTRIPSYSPEAIAEHTFGLLMCLNRHLVKSFQRVKDFNFTLEGLEGVTLKGKTVGVIGVGLIGQAFARIMKGVGLEILLYDPQHSEDFANEIGGHYVELEELLKKSDIVSLHCPLNEKTKYILNEKNLNLMKTGSFLLNTGRGGLIETKALINCLKENKFRGVGLDVYEYEEGVFFHDHSSLGINDENLLRLLSFPRVFLTSHQAFFTEEALDNIAKESFENIRSLESNSELPENRIVI